jgi:hypothetical protein
MSILSLLCVPNVVDLMSSWQRIDFGNSAMTLGDGSTPTMSSGTIIYHGMAFQYDLGPLSTLAADHYIFCNLETSALQSAVNLRLGSAVASGRAVPAVTLAMLQLGVVLGEALNAAAVQWHPAAIISGFGYFSESVTQYGNGAAFPAMLCVGFDVTQPEIVRTRGLKYLSGQELVFDHPGMPRHDAMRYVVRLVHDIVTQGAIGAPLEVRGMTAAETVRLIPDSDSNVLFARLI